MSKIKCFILFNFVIVILFLCYSVYSSNIFGKPKFSVTKEAEISESVLSTTQSTKKQNQYKLPEQPHLRALMEKILKLNEEEKVYNEDLFGKVQPEDLVIVVQVHNRLIYLKELINSFRNAAGINKTLLIFSHDSYIDEINEEIGNITFVKVMQIFFPNSLELFPEEFPGLSPGECGPQDKYHSKLNCSNVEWVDKNGKYRNPGKCQIKHHWWWKANYVFQHLNKLKTHVGYVMFLEEDHYLAPDFLHVFALMLKTANQKCQECKIFSIGTTNEAFKKKVETVRIQLGMDNFGLTFNKTTWTEIVKYKEQFCTFDDYNWDWTLQFLFQKVLNPTPVSMVMLNSRLCHIGACGSHFHNDNCEAENFLKKCDAKFSKFTAFPESVVVQKFKIPQAVLLNGGWADPRDHELCLSM